MLRSDINLEDTGTILPSFLEDVAPFLGYRQKNAPTLPLGPDPGLQHPKQVYCSTVCTPSPQGTYQHEISTVR